MGMGLAFCSTLPAALSPSGPANVFAWLCVRENVDIESWGGGRVGRISRRKVHRHNCILAIDSEHHRLLDKSVPGRAILLIRFPAQLYPEDDCTEQFWQYQKPSDFLHFNIRKEKEGILHQVILHLTKIFE